jgi:hypothetical protein
VRVSPRRNGGLVDGAELAWDAARGVPLRASVYAKGDANPVLELAATNISFGAIPASTFAVRPPAGTKTVAIDPPGEPHAPDAAVPAPSGTSFTVNAPPTLAGSPRSGNRKVDFKGHAARLVTYGSGLGGIAVLESAHDRSAPDPAGTPAKHHDEEQPGLSLPTVTINGATAQELTTALGSVLRFSRGGIDYVVAGSMEPSVLRAAASAL